MRTNIELDDKLVMEAMNLADIKTKKDVVNIALKEFVNKMKKQELAKLWGSNFWEGDLEQMRTNG
jgi:Arc/MetJ family transcription regulator